MKIDGLVSLCFLALSERAELLSGADGDFNAEARELKQGRGDSGTDSATATIRVGTAEPDDKNDKGAQNILSAL